MFGNIFKKRRDELRMYLIGKWQSSSQEEVIDHIIGLMSEQYNKTAFGFV